MARDAADVIQDLFNDAVAQAELWRAYAATCSLGYNRAYKSHKDALDLVKKQMELDQLMLEAIWGVFIGVIGKVASAWLGRLLEPAEKMEGLASEIFNKTVETMEDTARDKAWDIFKDSAAKQLAEKSDEDRPWEPVGIDPSTYAEQMRKSIALLANHIEKGIIDLKSRVQNWPPESAAFFAREFKRSCPYFADLPTDKDFEDKMARQGELGMWIRWALDRDEGWWRRNDNDTRSVYLRVVMEPILGRLVDKLGVPLGEVSSVVVYGSTVLPRRFPALDMLKFIQWAKRNKRWILGEDPATEQACFLIRPNSMSRNHMIPEPFRMR
jgi:hypothetical protein